MPGGRPVFLYGADAEAAAEALEVPDVPQDDLVSGAAPLPGKRQRSSGEDQPQ